MHHCSSCDEKMNETGTRNDLKKHSTALPPTRSVVVENLQHTSVCFVALLFRFRGRAASWPGPPGGSAASGILNKNTRKEILSINILLLIN